MVNYDCYSSSVNTMHAPFPKYFVKMAVPYETAILKINIHLTRKLMQYA